MKINNPICIFCLIFAFIACSNTTKSKDDTSVVDSEKVSIIRFDKEIYNYVESPTEEKEEKLKSAYPNLITAFGISVINSDPKDAPDDFFKTLQEYFSHPMLKNIYIDASSKTFNNIEKYELQLGKANARIKEEFEGKELPRLAMHVSGLKENILIMNDMLSLSCDKYLGSDYPAYSQLLPSYQRHQMKPEFIARDYVKAWLVSDVRQKQEKVTLLNSIIEEGKTLYLLSVILPEYSEKELIGYTESNMEWCKTNEKMIWDKMVKQKDIYSKENLTISKYVEDAPYTVTISKQSPGRVGSWIGWQIVKHYMKKTDTSARDLVKLDAQSILKDSKYNP